MNKDRPIGKQNKRGACEKSNNRRKRAERERERGLTKCFFDGTITWEGSLEGEEQLLPALCAANGSIHNARHRRNGNYTVTL